MTYIAVETEWFEVVVLKRPKYLFKKLQKRNYGFHGVILDKPAAVYYLPLYPNQHIINLGKTDRTVRSPLDNRFI